MSDLEVKVKDLKKFMLKFLLKIFRGKARFRQVLQQLLFLAPRHYVPGELMLSPSRWCQRLSASVLAQCFGVSWRPR